MKTATKCAFICLQVLAAAAAPLYRPEQERRTVSTDLYELVVQKNGQTDINLRSGAQIFDDLHPEILWENASSPEPLPLNWKRTGRAEVNDVLGKGQGIQFAFQQCEWYLRAYPTKPFLTLQVVFINTSEKPVKVSKLIPCATVEDGGLSLGATAGAIRILDNGKVFQTGDDYPEVSTGKSVSEWNAALLQPENGRSLIAGFLTNLRARTQLVITDSDKSANQLETFRAECVYEPPVEVPPQGRLESEVLYLAVAETNVLEGLQRFGKAEALWNKVSQAPPSFIPHGWDSWSTHFGRDISEAALLRELDIVDMQLKRYGWNHFAIDAGWEQIEGDWEADTARFPHGMAWLAEQIHARGMTAGLWIAPFTVAKKSGLAQAHPEWLTGPDARGRLLIGDDKLILDPTVPEAYAHTRDVCRKVTHEWGYDALVEADFVYYLLLVERYARPNTTKVEALRIGMQAIREGLGPDKFLMATTPHPITGVFAQGVRVGRDCAPIWQVSNRMQPWGAVDALTNSVRRFYLTPYLYMPDQDCAFFAHEDARKRWDVADQPALTWDQSVAWLTGAALTGGAVKIGNAFSTLSEQELNVLRKLLPAPPRPAIPIDLFQPEPPRIWHLPLTSLAGEWHILGLFNWNAQQSAPVRVDFAALGLPRGAYYTVYDFWQEHYHGTAADQLEVQVPPGSVRLLGLRPFENHPMLLASDRHITQGALEYQQLSWHADTRTLEGAFTPTPDTTCQIRILVPEPYQVSSASHPYTLDSHLLTLTLQTPATDATSITWNVTFSRD